MSKKYALVYWVHSKTIQTLESIIIPVASRYDGATVRLKSQDNKNKFKYYDARIIRMSDDVMELNQLEVDEETGLVIDRSQKAFSKKVLASRIALKDEKKESEKRKNSVEEKREDDMLKNKSFLLDEPKSKRNKPSKSVKNSASSKNVTNKVTKRGRPKNVPSAIPSTLSANTEAQIQKIETTGASFSSDAVEISKGIEKIVKDQEKEEVMDIISPKNVCFIPGVTPEILAFHKFLVASMEYSLDPGRQDLLTKITNLTKDILTNAPNKVEIFPNTGCYLPKSVMTSIDLLNSQENDWKKHLTNILVQMFGDKLKFMSLKGYRGNIAIHSKIRRALFNLINDKADPQISLKVFNGTINKACTNRKTSSTKICLNIDDQQVDDDDKDDDDDDDQNFDGSSIYLNNYNRLPRSLSSSPVISCMNSRTPSPARIEEIEGHGDLLGNKNESDLKNELPLTDRDNTLLADLSQTTFLNTDNSTYPPETTLEVDIPSRNRSREQSTITLICSESIVQHQPAVESKLTPIHSFTQSQLNNISTATSSNSNSYLQQPSNTITSTSGPHADAYGQNPPINVPTTSSIDSNQNPGPQPTVPSVTAPTYPDNVFQRQMTNAPSVSRAYANQYSQNQSNTTTVNSYPYPQQQSTFVSTNNPAYLSSHTQSQFTAAATDSHSFSQNQFGNTHSDSYYQNNQQMNRSNGPIYNHPHFYNQAQQTFGGYYGGPQWFQPQQSFAPHHQNQSYHHQENFNQNYNNNNQ